jgi:hypothetical protein
MLQKFLRVSGWAWGAVFFVLAAQSGEAAQVRVAVLRLDYTSDGSAQAAPRIQEGVFTHPRSMAAYFSEASFGAVSLVGRVYNIVPPAPLQPIAPGATALYNNCWPASDVAVLEAAAQAGVRLARFNKVVFVVTRPPGHELCGGGVSTFGPNTYNLSTGPVSVSISRVSGDFVVDPIGDYSGTTHSTLAHELAHSFGLDYHSNAYWCSDGQLLSSNLAACSHQSYGDLYSMIGLRSQMSLLSSPHTAQLGWLPAAQIRTVSASGTYTMNAYAGPLTPGSQEIRAMRLVLPTPLPMRASGGAILMAHELFFELRSNSGFDARSTFFRMIPLESGPPYIISNVDGVLITAVGPAAIGPGTITNQLPVQLIQNPAYAPNAAADAYLRPGRLVTLPGGRISFEVLSVNRNVAPNTVTLRFQF